MSMEFSGEYRLPVAPERVWAALNEPEVLRASIAGCTQLERTGENAFDAVVTARVGPISATFRGSVELSDLDPPRGYTLTGRGQGGAAGFARMTSRVSLEPEGEGATLLRYTAQAEIGGKLASVGSRLVQTVARKNADDFFRAFSAQLGGGAAVEAAAASGEVPAEMSAVGRRPATAAAYAAGGGLGAPVPAWLVVFGAGLGLALGYCLALLAR